MHSLKLFTAALLMYSSTGIAQNLVPNPSFETVGTCPIKHAESATHFANYTQEWYSANIGSPDLFTACSGLEKTTPLNIIPPNTFRGTQTARTGSNFTGFYHYGQTAEYLGSQLSQPLEAGKNYSVSFYVACAGKQRHITDQIGIHISDTAVRNYVPRQDGTYPALTQLTPQIISTPGEFIQDTTWTKISGYYTAKGSEQYITLGCFFAPSNSPHLKVLTNAVTPGWGRGETRLYYFVDDVSVVPTISGALTLCAQASQTYSISPVDGATDYQWILPQGWSGSSNTNSIEVTAGNSGGILQVIANDPNETTYQIEVKIQTSAPVLSGNITGDDIICTGIAKTFQIAAAADATHYSWTLPEGWNGTSESNSISLTPNTEGSGTIAVAAHNTCGTSGSKTFQIEVTGKPGTPGVLSGANTICENTASQYAISHVDKATYYTWVLPVGWSGTSLDSFIVATSNQTSGTIKVAAANGCGVSEFSEYTITVVAPLSSEPLIISGPSTICAGDTAEFSILPLDTDASYQWQVPQGWNAQSSGTNLRLIALYENTNGQIGITAGNSCSATATGSKNVDLLYITATVVENEGTLSSLNTTADSYQWLNCEESFAPAGSNLSTYTPSQNGIYALRIQQNGCVDTSACTSVSILQTSIDGSFSATDFAYYPNPVSDWLTVQIPASATTASELRLVLSSYEGKNVYEQTLPKEDTLYTLIPVEQIPNGVYLLTISSKDFVVREKISILR
jgi:hypothetical protein